MTAQSNERAGVSEVDFGGKSGLNLTSCEDQPKVGDDCNGIVHDNAEEIDVELNDGSGGDSDVFVHGVDTVSDTLKTDLQTNVLVDHTEAVGEAIVEEKTGSELNVSSPTEGEPICVEKLNFQQGGNSESFHVASVVSSSEHDVTAEDSDCQTNRDEVEKSVTVEEQNKLDSAEMVGNQESLITLTEVVGSEPHQIQNEKVEGENKLEEAELHQLNNREGRVEEQTGLDSVVEIGEDQHCSLTAVPVSVESKLHELDYGDEKDEGKNKLGPVEAEENLDCSQTAVPDADESKLHQLGNEEEKVEEKINFGSAEEVEVTQKSQHTVESEFHQLDNEEGNAEQHSGLDSAEVEDQDSHITATRIVEFELHQLDNGEDKETGKLDSGMPVEEPAGHLEAEQEISLEMVTCPVDDSQLKIDSKEDIYESGESVPTFPVERTLSETEVIIYSAEDQGSTSTLPIGEIESDSSNINESPENIKNLPCPAGDLKSELDVGDTSEEGGKSLPISEIESESSNVNEYRETPESLPCPADNLKSELDVGDTSVESGKSLPTVSADSTCLESEVGDASVERGESMSTCAVDVKSEARIGNGAIRSDHNSLPISAIDEVQLDSEGGNISAASSEDMPTADDVNLEYVVSNSTVGNGGSIPDCVNDVIAENGEQSIGEDTDGELICAQVEGIEGIDVNGSHASSQEDSSIDNLEGQKVDEEVGKSPFCFLIRIPRFVDDKIRDQIRLAQQHVDEKTRSRDAIRLVIQSKRAICSEYRDKFEAARAEERAAKDALYAKRQEMDAVQSVINRMKNATSIEDIADRIYNMEHMIEHETMPLKEEKLLIREIKQLKNMREQLCSSFGGQTEAQPTSEQREKTEERFKILKQELDSTRNEVLRTEGITRESRKIYFDENDKLRELQAQFRAADDLRQEAYSHLQNLKKQFYEKNKYFRMYKDDMQKAEGYASNGDKDALRRLCVNQVETIMELWNKNDEFRNEYIRCNTMSTLWRLKTLDGRSLGPDEEPPVLRNVVHERVDNTLVALAKTNFPLLVSTSEEGKSVLSLGPEKEDAKCVVMSQQKNQEEDVKSMVQNNSTAKSKKTSKPISLENGSAAVSGMEEKSEEENKQTKEEEELARKAEDLRKEEAAAKLKEQQRMEEKAKAKEAEERKRRNAEKAQRRAELRAQKEAELKEKEREKRMKKKEKKAAAAAATSCGIKEESALISENTSTETTHEPEAQERATTVTKRPQKSSLLAKQTKTKSLPPPLRNRSKRRMQPWMWVLLMVLVVLAFFLVGNSGYSSKFRLGF